MSKVDWTKAPEDAQFYSMGCFRRSDDGFEYRWNGKAWIEVGFCEMGQNEEKFDFEMRPESSESGWNGEGLPPVGTVCEIKFIDGSWRGATITAYGKQHILFEDSNGNERVEYLDGIKLRPLKSERDKWIDAARQAMRELAPYSSDPIPYLYDALKSGKLNTP